MKFLSRKEEIILLAVWKMQGDVYGVTIREYIKQTTGADWLFGAIYAPLGRLVDNGYVRSLKTDPEPVRGGRSKILYELTNNGQKALKELQKMNSSIWNDIPNFTVS